MWYGGDRPTTRSDRVDGSTLILDTGCGKRCSASYTVTVPAEVAVTGRIGTGTIDLSGVSVVDVAAADGNVTVHSASGTAAVKTGDIEGRRPARHAHARAYLGRRGQAAPGHRAGGRRADRDR
jgi:hypothetical protein